MARPRACYIALFHGVHTDEKTVGLAVALGVSQETAVGHLAALWLELMAQRGSDSLDGVSDLAIAVWSRWPGDPAQFVSALRDCNWIKSRNRDGRESKQIASGWREANGRALRELERKRQYYRRLRDVRSDGERTENGRKKASRGTEISGNRTLPYPTGSGSPGSGRSDDPEPAPTGAARQRSAGPKPNGQETVLEAYRRAYVRTYRVEPTITAADKSQVGKLLMGARPADVPPAVWPAKLAHLAGDRYLADREKFVVEAGHPLRLLPTRISALWTAGRSPGAEPATCPICHGPLRSPSVNTDRGRACLACRDGGKPPKEAA